MQTTFSSTKRSSSISINFIVPRYANRGKLFHPAINLLYDNDTYIAGWIFFFLTYIFASVSPILG